MTALLMASHNGNTEVVNALIAAGADVDKARTDNQTSPMIISVESLDDVNALGMVQLLAMAGADLAHNRVTGALIETAADIATISGKAQTAAWLESVAGFSAAQVCVSLGDEGRLRALVRRQECDLFGAPGTPSLVELARAANNGVGGNAALLRLCRDVRLKWAPARHSLFHPAHRSTVETVMLIVIRARRRREDEEDGEGAWLWEVPIDVWFLIAEQFGRTGWPRS